MLGVFLAWAVVRLRMFRERKVRKTLLSAPVFYPAVYRGDCVDVFARTKTILS